jgi:hypothetical protein
MSRTAAVITVAAVATGLIVGVVIASSGGDGGSNEPVTTPELTVPGGGTTPTDRSTSRDRAGTTGNSGTTDSGGAATPAPAPTPSQDQTGGSATPQTQQDTPQTDTQPPSGSPASKYEDFCKQNPSSCGN